jgi:hypothetical protein
MGGTATLPTFIIQSAAARMVIRVTFAQALMVKSMPLTMQERMVQRLSAPAQTVPDSFFDNTMATSVTARYQPCCSS